MTVVNGIFMMDIDLNTVLTLKLGLLVVGGGLALAAAFLAWIHAQFIGPPVASLETRLKAFELSQAQQSGRDFPERVGNLEDRMRDAELTIATLRSSEAQRDTQLARGLAGLASLGDKLKDDMQRGDMESRLDSAEALVAARQVAVTLAKLQGQDALDRAKASEAESLADLAELKAEQRKLLDGQMGQKPSLSPATPSSA